MAVRFCEIGWLNVSVEYCVFCSSVFFCERKKGPLWEKERSSVRERKVLRERKNTNHANRKCQDILQAVPFYIREKAEYATRTCPSAFKNMLFLRQEGRLLRARRACPRTQNVTRWFLVGYILGCRRWYMRVSRVVSLVGYKDFLSFYCASPLTVFTPALAVTLCVLCMPKALCGLEMCAKRLC